jgi:hypothetical protein
VIVEPPRRDRFDRRGRETSLSAPRLIHAWRQRSWRAQACRTVTPLLASEVCQGQSEDAYDGPLVLRLVAGTVVLSTARVHFQGLVTMGDILFSLTPHWRFPDAEFFDAEAAGRRTVLMERKSGSILGQLCEGEGRPFLR